MLANNCLDCQLAEMKLLLNYQEEDQKDDRHQFCLIHNKPRSLEEDLLILLFHPHLLLICDSCQRKLNGAASVLLVNQKERKDLCWSCFLKHGDQNNEMTHYFARPSLNMELCQSGWTVENELLLLDALQRYGYGNWNNVKDYLDYHGCNFTQEEIQQHYDGFYLTASLQPITFEYPLFSAQEQPKKEFRMPEVQIHPQPPTASCNVGVKMQDIQGYNSKRQQHLFDYDPQAEELVARLEFSDQDSAQEVELKEALLQEYNKKVQERRKREEFVVEHRVLSEEHKKSLLKESKEKGEIRKGLSCFKRFMTFEEAENITEYLTLQTTLKSHIGRNNDPSFEKAFQALQKIKNSRQRTYFNQVPQLTVQRYSLEKRSFVQRALEDREVRQKVKGIFGDRNSLQVTRIGP